jgi:hypothetical protein
VFQVTNRGCFPSLVKVLEEDPNEVCEDAFDSSLRAERDEALEIVDGVDAEERSAGEGACRCARLRGLGAESSAEDVSYSAQSSSTLLSGRASRFWREAARTSKQ